MMGGFAQWERQEIKKRTVGGRERRAQQGLQPSRATDPMSYHIVGVGDVFRGEQTAEMIGKYLILEPEAAILRDLFTRYAAGESLRSLTSRLNTQGVPTRGGAPFWGISAVSYMLHNPVYKGLGTYGKRDHAQDETRLSRTHPHNGKPMKTTRVTRAAAPETWITWSIPAIVPEDEWDAVQARFRENKRLQSGNPKRVRMLAGRILCPVCGSGMMTFGQDRSGEGRRAAVSGTVYYICGRQLRRRQNAAGQASPDTVCSTAVYSIAGTEAAVVSALSDAAQRPAAIQAALDAYRETLTASDAPSNATDPRREIAGLDAALTALSAKESAAIKAQIAGIMAGASPDAYAAVFAAQRKDIENRHGELSALLNGKSGKGVKGGGAVPPIKEDAYTDMARVLASAEVPDAEKRAIVGEVIQAVSPIKDGARVTFLPGTFPCGSCSYGETVQAI